DKLTLSQANGERGDKYNDRSILCQRRDGQSKAHTPIHKRTKSLLLSLLSNLGTK
ncbi:hypothetical protein SK128_027142, partial [Halocaridina rubra]